MDFSGFDLNLLVALDALLAERHVSRAAERLHLSQSATSGSLARLRGAFHDSLLVQVGRNMTLTPLAENLVEPVREFLLQADAILHNTLAFTPANSKRKFRLTMSDYVETVVMPGATARIQECAPEVTLQLQSNVDLDSEALGRGEIDLAISPTPHLSTIHPSEPLFDDDYICMAWSGNTEVGERISLEEYLNLGHVVVRFGREQQLPTLDAWFVERFGQQRKIEVVTTAFSLAPRLLIGTSRIATLQRRLAEIYEQYLPVKLIPAPIAIPRLEESMQWHRSRDRDPGTIWLRAMLLSVAMGGTKAQKKQPVGCPGHRVT